MVPAYLSVYGFLAAINAFELHTRVSMNGVDLRKRLYGQRQQGSVLPHHHVVLWTGNDDSISYTSRDSPFSNQSILLKVKESAGVNISAANLPSTFGNLLLHKIFNRSQANEDLLKDVYSLERHSSINPSPLTVTSDNTDDVIPKPTINATGEVISADSIRALLAYEVKETAQGGKELSIHPFSDASGNITASCVRFSMTGNNTQAFLRRLGRDQLALILGTISSIDSVEQWKKLTLESNGYALYSLLKDLRTESTSSTKTILICKALRDVCALSPEVASVVTDTILRSNAVEPIFPYFVSLLQWRFSASENERVDSKVRRMAPRDLHFRRRRQLYACQALLALAVASDDAIDAMRLTEGLSDVIVECSSHGRKQRTRRWLRYPGELLKWFWWLCTTFLIRKQRLPLRRRPFMEAARISDDVGGQVQRTANQLLAALGHNKWSKKLPRQRGLRILSLDGGGSRGMVAVTMLSCLLEKVGGAEVADSFDMVAGTSTGGIIAFLTGLKRETSTQAVERYNQLIKQIFVKSALSTPLMLLTTASYDESHFMGILSRILGDSIMLDSRADPRVPLVFCVTSKMSSTPTHVSLLRNYNYAQGELADSFTIYPEKARQELGLPLAYEHQSLRAVSFARRAEPGTKPSGILDDHKETGGSRYPGSFRVLQRFALRASTAAPTVFKPVMMAGEIYADGGIVSSNPCALAIHEVRSLFPDIPIELIVSIGTGSFKEQKSAPRIGWDGIISQIVNSATDGEQIHHILEDILGDPAALVNGNRVSTKYFRFNPLIGTLDEFPIDVTDPGKLKELCEISLEYMNEPEQQLKVEEIASIFQGQRWTKGMKWLLRRQREKRLLEWNNTIPQQT